MTSVNGCGRGRSHSSVDDGDTDDIKQLRCHQKTAFGFLSKAIEIEESGKQKTDVKERERARELYMKGIEELQLGISIHISSTGVDGDRATVLKRKMQTNLDMALERYSILTADSTETLSSSSSEETSTLNTKQNSTSQIRGSRASKVNIPSSINNANKHATTRVGATRSNSLPRTTAGCTATSTRASISAAPSHKNTVKSSASSTSKPQSSTSRPRATLANFKNVDKKLAAVILDEVIDNKQDVSFSDISGLEGCKQALREIVILPALNPQIFTGLLSPARGLLLFGPPGNGKTMLAKAVSCECQATFFNISAASLTSKWVGEGEKLVRALFASARELQPSVIFIDEIDSLLCERRENESEASRRIKTQFLVEFDGVTGASADSRVLVMGATNRPFELDEAVIRRFTRRIYVPMPDEQMRYDLLSLLLSHNPHSLSTSQLRQLARMTEDYSASDLTALARDAALGPIRELTSTQLQNIDAKKVRELRMKDFEEAVKKVRCSVTKSTLATLDKWNKQYGDIS